MKIKDLNLYPCCKCGAIDSSHYIFYQLPQEQLDICRCYCVRHYCDECNEAWKASRKANIDGLK